MDRQPAQNRYLPELDLVRTAATRADPCLPFCGRVCRRRAAAGRGVARVRGGGRHRAVLPAFGRKPVLGARRPVRRAPVLRRAGAGHLPVLLGRVCGAVFVRRGAARQQCRHPQMEARVFCAGAGRLPAAAGRELLQDRRVVFGLPAVDLPAVPAAAAAAERPPPLPGGHRRAGRGVAGLAAVLPAPVGRGAHGAGAGVRVLVRYAGRACAARAAPVGPAGRAGGRRGGAGAGGPAVAGALAAACGAVRRAAGAGAGGPGRARRWTAGPARRGRRCAGARGRATPCFWCTMCF